MRIKVWAVGLFIIVGFALFTAILFLIGNRQKAFARHLKVYTEFVDIGGLAEGAKVRVSGLDAGKLKKVEIPKDSQSKFRLELEVDEKAHVMLRTDSLVSIQTEGVVGDKFIYIKKGSDAAEEVKAGATLPSKEAVDLSAMMEQASGMLNDVHAVIGDIQGRVDKALDSINGTVQHTNGVITQLEPNVNKIVRDGGSISGKVDTLVSDLNAGRGPAGLLLKDEATRQQLQATLSEVQQASARVDDASRRVDQIVEDAQKRDLIGKTDTTLDHVQSMSDRLDTTIQEAVDPDNLGQTGGANLRETLSNMNRSTQNLADDTEALKHNFFFRGFFKKRGFYNLEQLQPAEYVQACDRNKIRGDRKWLSAGTLVTADGNGREDLSAAGRASIDGQIRPIVNTLPQRLIIVEGYATAGEADRQFSVSQRRAELVRRYLEMHYHLRHSDLGIVALGNKGPENAGQSTWDGAAILLVDEGKKK